jgi:predicted GNAT family acetyltransferase
MPLAPTDDPAVSNNPDDGRYEIRVDHRLAGFATYVITAGQVVFTHTEIDPDFEGQGLGSRLAKAALDDVRAHHQATRPVCPFIWGYIEHHPEYADLVKDRAP